MDRDYEAETWKSNENDLAVDRNNEYADKIELDNTDKSFLGLKKKLKQMKVF